MKKKLSEFKKSNFLCVFVLIFSFFCSIIISCNKNDEDGIVNYDPSKQIELQIFYPDSGKYLEKVLISGSNFGTDPEKIRVYFNQKKASVIGSTGERMYVLAPRLPGDTVTISVAIGNDSVFFDKNFYYETSVSVTTIVGNGAANYKDGDLTQSELQPRYLCVDKENNVFVSHWVASGYHFARIDEEAGELITIARNLISNAPSADPVTGIITIPTETFGGSIGTFYTLDPRSMWAPKAREMKWAPDDDVPSEPWKHCMVTNPIDGYIYTRYWHGHIVKINPVTYEAETIYKTPIGATYGMTFNPKKPNILYFSMWSDAGEIGSSICSIDVTDPSNTFKKLTNPINGGHRDGLLENSQFRNPSQIFTDNDGNMYVADSGNHCIRRITPEGMVETVLGIPGQPGWKDGGSEEALFNTPRGIGIAADGTVYVADEGNYRIRKLSIN